MLDQDNYEAKSDTLYENTEISMGYSSVYSPLDECFRYHLEQEQ